MSAEAEQSPSIPAAETAIEAGTRAADSPAPQLTVLLAVHNARKYLNEAVQSILDQTFTDYEFLIIDDGSTDDSLQLLEAFARRDPRIRIITQANRGLTVTLNEGIRLARGEFLARMDGDDIALPERFSRQIAYLKSHPDCVMVGSRVLLIDPDGAPIREICQQSTHEEIDASLMTRGWPMVHPAVIIRTATLRQIGGYSELYRTNQDHDLFLRLAETGRIFNLPETLLKYRQHFKSISMENLRKGADPLRGIMKEAYRRRGMEYPADDQQPVKRPLDEFNHHRNWAWAALSAGNVATARKHAWKTFVRTPLSPQSWRMLYCAVRGR